MAEAGQARRPLACERKWVYLLLMLTAGLLRGLHLLRSGAGCSATPRREIWCSWPWPWAGGSGRGRCTTCLPCAPTWPAPCSPRRWPRPSSAWAWSAGTPCWCSSRRRRVAVLGFLPETAPHQIAQVTINFLCSMQYNTFRQAQDIPMATTFCTNHVRQVGVGLVHALHHPEEPRWRRKVLSHLEMLAVFVAGCAAATALSGVFLAGPSGGPCSPGDRGGLAPLRRPEGRAGPPGAGAQGH